MMKIFSDHRFERVQDDLVLKTIESVLTEVFGEKSYRKMVRIMKENYSVEWDDIPEKSRDFSLALRDILGLGSMIIEDLIVENLYNNLGLQLMWKKGFSFSDYIAGLPSTCGTASQR